MPIDYRALYDMADFEQVVDLEIAVWGINPRNALPANTLRAFSGHGGVVLGAFDGERLVGLAVAFLAAPGMLWSHMTGVHADYQGRGIGLRLKWLQRDWALANGIDEIRWTFDPIQRGNAHFNLHLLGARSSVYHDNYYGDMDDDINRGMPSDRLEACWGLRDARVAALFDSALLSFTIPAGTPVVSVTADVPFVLDGEPNCVQVTIPRSLAPLRESGKLLDAKLRLRQIMHSLFERGYTAFDFVDTNYVFIKS